MDSNNINWIQIIIGTLISPPTIYLMYKLIEGLGDKKKSSRFNGMWHIEWFPVFSDVKSNSEKEKIIISTKYSFSKLKHEIRIKNIKNETSKFDWNAKGLMNTKDIFIGNWFTQKPGRNTGLFVFSVDGEGMHICGTFYGDNIGKHRVIGLVAIGKTVEELDKAKVKLKESIKTARSWKATN